MSLEAKTFAIVNKNSQLQKVLWSRFELFYYGNIENDIFMNEVVSISYYGTLDTYQIFLFDVMHFMMY